MKFVVLLAILALLGGCMGGCPVDRKQLEDYAGPGATGKPAGLAPPAPPKTNADGTVDPLEEAKFEMQRLAEAAAAAEKRYEVLQRQAQDDQLRAQTMWITGICLLLAAVAGVAAFLVPIGKKRLAAVAVGFTTIAACAQAFAWAVPYLPWIGGAIVLGGGLWAAINWRALGSTVRNAAGHGDRLEAWFESDVLPRLSTDADRELVRTAFRDAKDESKREAEVMGVHGTLQYLRGKRQSLVRRIAGAVR